MSELEELRLETVNLYDDYLYRTEGRGVSYGEIAYIQGLSKKGLKQLCKEIEED